MYSIYVIKYHSIRSKIKELPRSALSKKIKQLLKKQSLKPFKADAKEKYEALDEKAIQKTIKMTDKRFKNQFDLEGI